MQRARAPIVFFGSSGYAVALRDVMRRSDTLEPLFDVVAYIDDFRGDRGDDIDGAPVITFDRWLADFRSVPCFVTLGDPAARRTVAERLRAAGATFPAVYDADELGERTIGEGSYVSAGLTLGAGARIGAFVQVLPFAEVPPYAAIGDYVTLCPRAIVTGNVEIGDGCFLGAGCRIVGGTTRPLRIGRDARIAAGAVVDRPVGDGQRAYGAPARIIDKMHVIG